MRRFSIRDLSMLVMLVLAWCALWRDISAANVLSGLAIGAVIIASGIGTFGEGGVKFGALMRLIWLVVVDLTKSTVSVAREVLTPTDYTDEAIVAVHIPDASRDHLLLLIVAITLTPGTAVVDADTRSGTLFLHLLHHDRLADTIAHVERLADLACEALPVSNDPGART